MNGRYIRRMLFAGLFLALSGCQQDGGGDDAGTRPMTGTGNDGAGSSASRSTGSPAAGNAAGPSAPQTPAASPAPGADTPESADTAAEAPGFGADKAEDYMDDSVITAKIKQDILTDPLLKATQIDVSTENGVVKLSGAVDSQQSIDRVKAIAHSVTDVKAVESELVVKKGR